MNPHTIEVAPGPAFGAGEVLGPAAHPRPAEEETGKDGEYLAVPPTKSITVSVRYNIRGRGQPLPYHLDEEMDG